MRNRVRKIQDKSYIRWRHVGTTDNPADLGSRGGHLFETTNLWWPPDIVTSPRRGKIRPHSSGKYKQSPLKQMTNMMSWYRNGTYGQPSESGLGCRALFETAEPNTSKESPDQSLLKKLVSTGKEKEHTSDAKVQAGFRKISNVSISKRTQMDRTNVEGVSKETTPFNFQMMLCSAKGWYCTPTFRLSMGESVWRWKRYERNVVYLTSED